MEILFKVLNSLKVSRKVVNRTEEEKADICERLIESLRKFQSFVEKLSTPGFKFKMKIEILREICFKLRYASCGPGRHGCDGTRRCSYTQIENARPGKIWFHNDFQTAFRYFSRQIWRLNDLWKGSAFPCGRLLARTFCCEQRRSRHRRMASDLAEWSSS